MPDQVREETGSRGFVGGVLNPGSGGIHPLNYLRGLAKGVAQRGIAIHQESPALDSGATMTASSCETPGGTVRARQAIIATNSYSDLTPATARMQRTLMPFRSAMIATEKLSPNLAGSLMPTRRTYTETKRMMRWFRMVDDRVIFGGRGAFGKTGFGERLRRAAPGDGRHLSRAGGCRRWPIAGPGLVGMTLDSVAACRPARRPHPVLDGLQRRRRRDVEPDGPLSRGAACAARRRISACSMRSRLRTIPFYPLREPAVRMVAGWYQFLDAIGR